MNISIKKINIYKTNVSTKTIWLFIKIIDGNKNFGYGEATLSSKIIEGNFDILILNVIKKLKEKLIKNICFRTFTSFEDLFNSLFFSDINEAAISSAVMQAAFDLQAKLENKQIFDLLNGQNRNEILVYANFNRGTIDRSIENVKKRAIQVKNSNFKFAKFAPFDEVDETISINEIPIKIKSGMKRIEVIKEVFSNQVSLLIDCHSRFNEKTANYLLDVCKDYQIYWIEEPVKEKKENIETITKLRKKANSQNTFLAGLEKKILSKNFLPYIKSGCYDAVMPDIKYCGGPLEMFKISNLLSKYKTKFSPHNPSGPIAHLMSIQNCISAKEFHILEYQFNESELFYKIINEKIPKINNGIIDVKKIKKINFFSLNENLLEEIL